MTYYIFWGHLLNKKQGSGKHRPQKILLQMRPTIGYHCPAMGKCGQFPEVIQKIFLHVHKKFLEYRKCDSLYEC